MSLIRKTVKFTLLVIVVLLIPLRKNGKGFQQKKKLVLIMEGNPQVCVKYA